MNKLTIKIISYIDISTKEVLCYINNKKLPYEYTFNIETSNLSIESEIENDLVTKGIEWDNVEIITE